MSNKVLYERIKHLYETGQITSEGVRKAVTKGLITETQCAEIIGEQADD